MIAPFFLQRSAAAGLILVLSLQSGLFHHSVAAQSVSSETRGRVLIFTKAKGYYHKSIPTGIKALQQLCHANNIQADTTTDAGYFFGDSLARYNSVIFLSTSGDVLNDEQQDAFRQYIEMGGGFVGIHSATDTEYDWPWYGKMLGAWFSSHPKIQQARLIITNPDHPATRGLQSPWVRTDEWYNFKNMDSSIQVLVSLDENSYEGGLHGAVHPVAWCHSVGKGRSFYTSGGHSDESYSEPAFLNHLLGGIQYANKKAK